MIKNIGEAVLELSHNEALTGSIPVGRDTGEMAANIKLAYRCLEDARMRVGKAVQAFDGGQSCYKQ
jgi:hypothetical protein